MFVAGEGLTIADTEGSYTYGTIIIRYGIRYSGRVVSNPENGATFSVSNGANSKLEKNLYLTTPVRSTTSCPIQIPLASESNSQAVIKGDDTTTDY